MPRSCFRWPYGAIAALAALSAPLAIAQSEDGSDGLQRPAAELRVPPEGLDDAFYPDADLGPAFDGPDVRDSAKEPAPGEPALMLWEQLETLDAEMRANAEIELELSPAAPAADREAAAAIAKLWNRGEYKPALDALRALEEAGVAPGLGIAWRTPVPSNTTRLADVRIGGTRADAQTMNIDFDAQNGNLFMIVRWGSTTGTSAWVLNTSTNGGLTWSETYTFASSVGLIDVDCAVVGNFVYVSYVVGNATAEARLRRCLVSTGGVDAAYGFEVIFNSGANTVEEVALAANADDFDNRIYYVAIQSNDVLRYAWDVSTDGTTFTDESPPTSNPEFGLDVTFTHQAAGCAQFVYISYAGNDGNIHVRGKADPAWSDWIVEAGTGTFRNTAISAFGDTIICAFEYPYAEGTGIRYRISYNCGGAWSPGTIAVPDGATVFGYFAPDVDARDGDGTAITYQAEAGALDPMYYRTRAGFAPGGWSDPSVYADHDVFTGSDTALAHVPALAGELFSHGAAYISLDPDNRTLYFDRPSAAVGGPCDDSTPPIIEITAPDSLTCACDMVQITGSVGDPDGTYSGDRLEYRRQGVDAWTVADTAIGARAGVLYTWDTSALVQDFYFVRIVGENECGLSGSDTTFVYHPTTFGNLEMRSPTAGAILGGSVCFDGTAWTQSCFDHYTLGYRPAGIGAFAPVDPGNPVYASTVINDPLGAWDSDSGPTAVPDGVYDVQLEGVNDCGDVATVTRRVTIDNTWPRAEITDPVECQTLDGVIVVRGVASDANISSWALQYTGGDAHGWVTIAAGNASVNGGVLGNWNTAGLRACAYTLRLTVVDQANVNCSGDPHRSDYYVSLNIGGCPTDLDGDGVTGLGDLTILLSAFGLPCP